MKRFVVLFVLTLISIKMFSQGEFICDILPAKDGRVFYSEVIKTEDMSASELYSNAKKWVSTTFRSAKSVIQSDVDGSIIVIKGRLSYITSADTPFTLTIQFKDGRFKYELTDLMMDINTSVFSKTYPIEEAPFVKDCIEKNLNKYNDFIYDFIDGMIAEIEGAEDDDW
ncbi:MAG TPA: hypothetical protein DEQ30_02950 [Porphyromonadaceae bacterium]|nr:hypothetical protein [Porphyromonadaceae bacterium]